MFLDHLTNLMWEDCKGKDIHINQPGILKFTATNENVSLIKWPFYNKTGLKYILELLDKQPYRDYLGQCGKNGTFASGEGYWDGCSILTCDNNRLDIDYDGYTWNNIRVDVPREEFKIASGNNSQIIETGDNSPVTTGDKSPITTGDDSPINQQDINIAFAKGTIFGVFITLLFKILYDFRGKKLLKRLLQKK